MKNFFRLGINLFAIGLIALAPNFAIAQDEEPPVEPTETESAEVDAEVDATDAAEEEFEWTAQNSASNAWMLTCCALVLFMTAPGLALFYGGLVRKKNVVGVMMQCFFLMGLMTCIWGIYGYSLAFGEGEGALSKFIGDADHLFMKDVDRTWDEETGAAVTPMNGEIPTLTFMLFQGMFFIITPALICGAFAERMKFSAMVIFSVVWGTFIYCPLCHWVWGGGILAYGDGLGGGALDFAGGTVVHISSGVSALIAAYIIGPRYGFGHEPMPPHNLTYTAIGAAMLWIGWFGFNAGSELASDDLTSSAFATTHFSAAAGAVAWAVMEWLLRGKPTLLGTCSGAVAGLVCITPAAGFVTCMPALLMGAIAGIACFFACSKLKTALGYDDSLDAFGIHGIGGTLGAVLTGVFATRAAWDINDGNTLGIIEGNYSTIVGQIIAVVVTYIFVAVGSFIILKVVDLTIGLRVTKDAEQQGLDLAEHDEEGYIFL